MACNTISRALSLSNHGPPLRKISIELRATPGEDVIQAFLSDRLCGSIDFPISPISPLRKELRPGIKVSFDPYEYMYIYIYIRSIQAGNKMETGRSRGCWITARRGDLGVLIQGGYRGGGGGGGDDYTCESNELRWNEGVRMQAGRIGGGGIGQT